MTTPINKRTAVLAAVADPTKAVVEKQVTETTHFARNLTEDEKNAQQNKTESNSENPNQDSNKTLSDYRQGKAQVAENRLAKLFDDLADYEEEENEIYYALVTRKQDMMGDRFRNPVLNNIELPPLQVHSGMMLQFVNILLKANGNSGGRFNIVITDKNGNLLEEIGVNGICFADPIEDEKPTVQGGNEFLEFMKFQSEQNRLDREAARKETEALLLSLKPTKDRFSELAEQRLQDDILNPDKRKSGINIEETMTRVIESQAVMATMANGFAKMFDNGGSSEKDEGLLKFILGNEMIVEKGTQTIEHMTNVFGALMTRVLAPTAPPITEAEIYEPEETEPYPPIAANSTTTKTDEDINMEKLELIKQVIAELESDRPLNETNKKIQELKSTFPDMYEMLKQTCVGSNFNEAKAMLGIIAREQFNAFKNDEGELKESINARLQELYEFMKSDRA